MNAIQMPDSLKKLFLIEFTKELIINSKSPVDLSKAKKAIEISKRINIAKIQKPITIPLPQQPKQLMPVKKQEQLQIPQPVRIQIQPIKKITPNVLRIPETRLPETFGYLKPIPIALEIDLGKLNPLAKDPNVRAIECNGPDEQIIVEGRMGRKTTGTILTKEDIEELIKKFSEVSKIPLSIGIYRVVVGKLLFSAIISDIVSSKFIIKKL